MNLESLQQRIVAVETALILLTITSIAIADAVAGPRLSLGPLYLIPISYSALSHRLRTTLGLVVACIALRQWFGPLGDTADPWLSFFQDLAIAGVFLVIVFFLRRLGAERRRIFELARSQRDELASEVEMAAAVQKRLISLNDPPASGLDFAAKTELLRGVGGDYYDFIELGSRQCAVVIADISGKGMPAALLMPALRLGIRSLVAGREGLSERLRRLNQEFCRTTEPRHYGTLFYASMNLDSGAATYVNAGHVPPILVEADGSWRCLEIGGAPIGLLDESRYESEEIHLAPGSTLLLYTDGVTEAANDLDEELGFERLVDLVVANRTASAERIVAAVLDGVSEFLDGHPSGDDTTVIVLKADPSG